MRIIYSCVIDRDPRFALQGLSWVFSLKAVGVKPEDILVNLTPPAAPFRERFQALGVSVKETPLFADKKHCNKVAQLRNIDENVDFAVCCDTDTVFLRNIEPDLRRYKGRILGKIVDFANPPIDVFRSIIDSFPELGELPETTTDVSGEPTFSGSFNGGFYVFPGGQVRAFSKKWEEYALAIFENNDRMLELGTYGWHIDQISFTCALHALDAKFVQLPLAYNYPLHCKIPAELELAPEEIRVLHYHSSVDENLLPVAPQTKRMDLREGVADVREQLRALWYLHSEKRQKEFAAAPVFTFVMGFHRSGTSLLAAGCDALGYDLGSGELLGSASDNPKGYFENRNLVKLNEKIMQRLSSDWDDIFFSYDGCFTDVSEEFAQDIQVFLENEYLTMQHHRYVLKDPRCMQTYALWRHALEQGGFATPEIIFIVRNPLECAQSQAKRFEFSFRERKDPFHFFGKDVRETLLLWYVYNVRLLLTLRQEKIVFLSYEELIQKPIVSLNRIGHWANIDAGPEKVQKFAESFHDSRLRNHQSNYVKLQRAAREFSFVAELFSSLHEISKKDAVCADDIEKIISVHKEPYAELMQYDFLGRLMAVPKLQWIRNDRSANTEAI